MKLQARPGKIKVLAVIRDPKTGHPIFDDYVNIPDYFWASLSESDKLYIEKKREEIKNGHHS